MSNKSNLLSPNETRKFHDYETFDVWLSVELARIEEPIIARIMGDVCANFTAFVRWAKDSSLVFEGCTRVKCENERCEIRNGKIYHKFTPAMKQILSAAKVRPDGRENGPAITAFIFAKGERPPRYGSNNGWSIHHIYSGKFPYPGKGITLHAKTDPKHFTETAGLVAIHPLFDNAADEFPFFSWLLRAEAFKRFGYDPDNVFHDLPNDFIVR